MSLSVALLLFLAALPVIESHAIRDGGVDVKPVDGDEGEEVCTTTEAQIPGDGLRLLSIQKVFLENTNEGGNRFLRALSLQRELAPWHGEVKIDSSCKGFEDDMAIIPEDDDKTETLGPPAPLDDWELADGVYFDPAELKKIVDGRPVPLGTEPPEWYKVPGFCDLTITCDGNTVTLECCCSFGYECRWSTDNHGIGTPF